MVVALTTGCAGLNTVPGHPVAAPEPLPTVADYYAQRVEWRPCVESPEADCGDIRIPVDYANPGAQAITMPLVRLRATSPEGRLGVLTMNPGGPGESGYQQVLGALDPDDTGLRKFRVRYDLVGFDPRGVGRTAPVRCLDDRATDDYYATDFTPTTPEQLTEVAAAHRDYAAACLRNTGRLLGFVGTEFVAKDMDVMRSALGESRLNYLGFSYGSRLGLFYAEEFPDRVGRMLLDSVDDPSSAPDRWEFDDTSSFPVSTRLAPRDQVVYDMLSTCAARSDCPLGNDAAAAMTALRALIDKVDANPIPVDDGRKLGSNLALLGLFETTYDASYQKRFEQAIVAAQRGDGTPLAKLADSYVGRGENGRFSSSDPAFWAIQCANDDPARYRTKTEEQIMDALNRVAERYAASGPLFGANRVFSTPLCLFWQVPPSRASAGVDAKGAPTIVLVNNTGDPATPLEDAEHVADTLDNAVLVVNEHDGHIAFDNGSECVDGIVLGFFFDGELPAPGTRCRR
ncbi:alpha/beta hydrolase [Nocardia sp. XZ_19_385]|uniref:alpha/beta hydrolase n=1 Tax=Nocardia sp. XZ_19_385 TaxID=2769488 RepID=UPI001890A60A|nr:alpha/beta hydrolase [Nocardia sp. XZ_19_385]